VRQLIELIGHLTLPLASSITLQLVTTVASIGRVSTSTYIVSRGCNALTLGAVAVDFAVKYFWTGRADDLTAQVVFAYRADDLIEMLVFTALTLQTVLILQIGALDRKAIRGQQGCPETITLSGCAASPVL
jgi:hypothetical protein